MLPVRMSFALAALAPLPLVVSLALYERAPLASELEREIWFAAAALVFTGTVGVYVVRAYGPQYLLSEGSAAWFMVALVGGGVYILSWFYGRPAVSLVGLVAVYLGLAAYLGGRRIIVYLGAEVLALATLAIPSFFAGDLLEAVAVVLVASAASLVFHSSRARGFAVQDCDQCQRYRVKAKQSCDRCGKMLLQPKFGFPYRRLLAVAVATAAVVVLLVGTSVPIASQSNSGLLIVTYGLSGVQQVTPLPSYPGWKVSLVDSQSNQTFTTWDYSLSGGVNATISLSHTARDSASGALGSTQGLVEKGTTVFSSGEVGLNYAWTRGNSSHVGTLIVAPLTYLSGGQVVEGYAAFFFTGAAPSQRGAQSDGLTAVASATASSLKDAKAGFFLLSTVVGPVGSNLQYAFLVLTGVLFVVVGGVVRGTDADSASRFDSALSLDPAKFKTLALISSCRKQATGAALFDKASTGGGWDDFSPTLEMFSALGILKRTAVVDSGVPKALWVCRV